MKMRVLYYTNKAKLKNIAGIITDNYATEKVNCDKERLVVMIVSVSKDPDNALVLFCKELTKQRAANVAFLVDGSADGAKVLIDAVKSAGANAIEDVLYVKGGLPFLGGVKDDEKKNVTEWMDKITANLQ